MSVNQVTGGAPSIPGLGTASDLRPAQKASAQNQVASPVSKTNVAAEVNHADLKKSVDAVNHFINGNNALNFNVDQASGRVVVQIVDRETNKVIQQIPSEEMLEIAKDLGSKKGVLLNAQA